MRRTACFFLNCTIGFFLVGVVTLTIQIILNAPMPVGGRVAGIQIHSVFIPGQAIACTQTESQDRCQVSLLGRPLELTLTSRALPNEVMKCQLSYAGQTAECKGDYHAMVIGGPLPVITTASTLGLSTQQRADLRELYPQRNFFLHIVGEDRLLQWNLGIAIAAGVLTFLFGWLNYSRGVAYAFFGAVVFVVAFLVGMAMLLGLGYVD